MATSTAQRLAHELSSSLQLLLPRLGDPIGLLHLLHDLGVPFEDTAGWLGVDVDELVDLDALDDDEEPPPADMPSVIDDVYDAVTLLVGLVPDDEEEGFEALEVLDAVDAVLQAAEGIVGQLDGLIAGAAQLVDGDALETLPRRLLEWLVVERLETTRPLATLVLEIAGVVERWTVPGVPSTETTPGTPAAYRKRFHVAQLAALAQDPGHALTDAHGWGDPDEPLDTLPFARLFARILRASRVPVAVDGVTGELAGPMFRAGPTDQLPTAIEVVLELDGGQALTDGTTLRNLPSGASVVLEASGDLSLEAGLRVEPPFRVGPTEPGAELAGRVGLTIHAAGGDEPVILFGDAGGTRLEAAAWRVGAGLDAAADLDGAGWGFVVGARIDDGSLVIDLGSGDGFIASVLPPELRVPFDLDLTFDRGGLRISGQAGLEASWSPGVALGPLALDRLAFEVLVAGDGIGIAGRAVVGLGLGPFQATVSGVGAAIQVGVGSEQSGSDDGASVEVRGEFLPPTGIGLRLDASVITGGGMIDRSPDGTRYSGALELELAGIGIHAIGLLDTQLPDGSDGYSLLVVIQASFPPIALPFGFTLTGVGGIVGLNRSIDVDGLRERFASGTVGRILAPEDPVGNAPALIEELGEVFPATAGTVVVGPTLQLGWSAFVRFDLGVFIELPGPTRVVLLGSVRAVIADPSGRPVLKLRLDVIGELDLVKRSLKFDAVLVDSQLLEVFELTGGAAFRLYWGDTPNVVLSVGGFHPRFDPAPLSFPPSLQRVAMTRGRRADRFYLRFEGYLAVTTNSLQFGAAAEVVLRASRFVAEGSFAFDVLIRTDPFRFELDLEASLRISYRGRTLAGVKISGALSGPGPVDFTGRLEFKILFVTISWRGSFQLGDSSPPAVQAIDDLVAELLPELEDPANLSAAGSDPSVTIEPDDAPAGVAFVLPNSRLTWQQRRAPLHLRLERLDGAPLTRPTLAWVTAAPKGVEPATVEVTDWFAPGRYLELSDAERVDREAYELADAGIAVELGGAIEAAEHEVDRAPTELFLPPPDDGKVLAVQGEIRTFEVWVQDAACGRIPVPSRPAPAIGVRRLTTQVRDERDASVLATASTVAQAHQHVRYEHAGAVVVLADDLRPTPEL
ncbi:MAG: hypothetical protein JJT89_02725 [Nitriliruptoraceae bacterium]|nr:hypothetical protein [Nitriliruptoraceae bacterium]